LINLTPGDIRQHRQFLVAIQRASPATVNRRLAAIRAFGRWGVSTSKIDKNPSDGIKGVEEQPLSPKWLSKKEQAAIIRIAEKELAAARTPAAKILAVRNKAILLTGFHVGLRVSEICALEIGDIEINERSGAIRVRFGKGGKARTVPANATVRQVLKEWLAVRPSVSSQSLFIGKRKEALTSSGVERVIAELGRLAGVEVTPHRLRHTFCKNLVDANVSLDRVAALASHGRISTTQRYTTPGVVDLQNAVRVLED
jgi:site-specific recombinase XerD